mgnify:CR=1 FL=1
MRKNVKQQLALRVLSTAALMAMVSSIATAAFADTYDLNKGSVTVETKDDGFTYVTQENTEINDHQDNTGVTITSNGEKTSNTITVETAKDQTTDVTLKDVNIEVDTSEAKTGAIEIKGDGDTNLELNGDNTVLTTNSTAEEHAAIEKADAYGTGTLTIKDDVNDDGTAKTGTEADTTGKLLAGGYHMAAAIGGGSLSYREDSLADTSNITITGGDITAVAGNDSAAAIGGGCDGTGKNIRIEGNAHVTALAKSGAGIGGGTGGGNSITITDNAVVNARSHFDAAIGGGDDAGRYNSPNTITISGNATVTAESDESSAIGDGRYGNASDLTINIEKNANVTAISSGDHPAIGTPRCIDAVTTTINITGGTVNAINSIGSDYRPDDGTGDISPAIGAVITANRGATCNVNINSSTGDTVVNAYIYGKGSGTAIGSVTPIYTYNDITQRYDFVHQDVPADSVSYNADGSSHFGERNSAIVNCYNNGTVNNGTVADENEKLDLPSTLDDYASGYNQHRYRHEITGGTLTKVVHNRKYMEKNPDIDTSKLENSDLHDWQLVGEVVEPTLEKDGYADYICRIDKCGQTKRVVLPKLTPEESGSVEMREVGVIFWDAAAQAAPAALQGKVLSADEQTATAEKAQVESLLADKANWKLAEDVGDLMIHPAADAAGTVYEQAVKASGCQYYVIANVTAQ